MSDNNNSGSSGIGFFGLLGIVFIALKLCKVIDWPWVWVLAPSWGGIAIGVVIIVALSIYITWLKK